jgi:arrestin-related trafficking adapter 4/5/7
VAVFYWWPFEVEIHGSMKESIEGLYNSYISYNLQATITRGRLGSSLRAYKPVRIVRAFHLAALRPTSPLREERVWPDKIEYQFCISQRAIVFGTALTIHMRFITLLILL